VDHEISSFQRGNWKTNALGSRQTRFDDVPAIMPFGVFQGARDRDDDDQDDEIMTTSMASHVVHRGNWHARFSEPRGDALQASQ
jgi:hypothetical protein